MMKRSHWPLWAGMISLAFLLGTAGCTLKMGSNRKPVALGSAPAAPERTPIYRSGDWIIARSAMHNHTVYSDGCRSPEDLLELARRQGMAILAITDHREGKVCMGHRVCVQTYGVESKGGYDVYYDHLHRVEEQAKRQEMILLKGVEVIPYFYNYGKTPHYVIEGIERHFTVYGVQDPQVFRQMPARREIRSTQPEPIQDQAPWQKWLDFLVDKGAMVMAAHVENSGDSWKGPIHIVAPAPIRNLYELKHLTGFSVLPEAWHEKTGGPGGLWDAVLLEYQAGLREKPLWAMGDADYHGPHMSLARAITLFYLKEFTEAEVYRCLREGRMIALQGDAFQNTYVAEWSVADSGRPAEKIMLGQTIGFHGTPVVRFALDHAVAGTRVRLVRNGKVVAEQEGSEITFSDQEIGKQKGLAYYRVEVIGPRANRTDHDDAPTMPESEIFVNPIFVRFAE
jgi:hypothetical protein